MGYINLNKKHFFHNADYFTNLLGDKNKLCIALKDNAYGHGIEPMAQLSQEFGIKHTMVRDIDEANIVAKYEFETILVLYEIPKKTYPSNYIFSINDIDDINKYPAKTKIELKIDTGMGRNGIDPTKIDQALDLIKQYQLDLFGVFTHFCCADEDNDKTTNQEKQFWQIVQNIRSNISTPFRVHCANSTGVHRVDNSKYDIARIGIGLYGYIDIKEYSQNTKPVLALYANKISTRVLQKGDTIGYGATYTVQQDNFTVSNYDIGYGDGFFRLNGRKKGRTSDGRAILGRVSMDSLSVQGVDDQICIFDDASTLASVHDTIHYEILTHLSSTIPRYIT